MSINGNAAAEIDAAGVEASQPASFGQFLVASLLNAVVAITLWTAFILVLSLIASIAIGFWQAVAAAWLCIAVAQTSATFARR